MNYYYVNPSNETVGPVNLDKLKELAAQGEITHDTTIVVEESMQYLSYRSVLASDVAPASAEAAPAPAPTVVAPPDVAPVAEVSPAPVAPAPKTEPELAPAPVSPVVTPKQEPPVVVPQASVPAAPAAAKPAEPVVAPSVVPAAVPAGPKKSSKTLLVLGACAALVVLVLVVLAFLHSRGPSRPTLTKAALRAYVDTQLAATNLTVSSFDYVVGPDEAGLADVDIEGTATLGKATYAPESLANHLKTTRDFDVESLAAAKERESSLRRHFRISASVPDLASVRLFRKVEEVGTELSYKGTLKARCVGDQWSFEEFRLEASKTRPVDALKDLPSGTCLVTGEQRDELQLDALVAQARQYIAAVDDALANDNAAKASEAAAAASAERAAQQPRIPSPLVTAEPANRPGSVDMPSGFSDKLPPTAAAVLALARQHATETVQMFRVRRGGKAEPLSVAQKEELRSAGVSARVIEALEDPSKAVLRH